MNTKEKDNKKTFINVRLDEGDKRAKKLREIFEDWKEQGHYSKVDKVVQDLVFLNDMEKIDSLRSFLMIYKSSKDFLAPIFDETEEHLLHQALDELFCEAVQNAHINVATRTFEIKAKFMALKQNISMELPVVATTITQEVPISNPVTPKSEPQAVEEVEHIEAQPKPTTTQNTKAKSVKTDYAKDYEEDDDFMDFDGEI